MNKDERARLGGQIRRVMDARGISQVKLEELSGIPRRTIGPIINGSQIGQQATLEALAKTLGIETGPTRWDDDFTPEVRAFLAMIGHLVQGLPVDRRSDAMAALTRVATTEVQRAASA